MNEADLTEALDTRDLLDAAHGPGVYALKADIPDTATAIRQRWDRHHDHDPPDNLVARLASAQAVAYVGASTDVYGRLCDHVAGDVRTASFCAAYPPVDVVEVWPREDAFDAEYNRAMRLVRVGWTVWCDGTLYG